MSAADHAAAVDGWLERAADLTVDGFLTAFERAFGAVWARAQLTLGEVTLVAIGDRVLHDAVARFPRYGVTRLEERGLDCADLIRDLRDVDVARDLRPFARHVLTELLTVLGALTADVLTPPLHEQLLGAPRALLRHATGHGSAGDVAIEEEPA